MKAVLAVGIFLLATTTLAAGPGKVKYSLDEHGVNGNWMQTVDDAEILLKPGQEYEFCCDDDGGKVDGRFEYDSRTQLFTFGGHLAEWGAGKLSGDEDLTLEFSFRKDGARHVLVFSRIPRFTFCPIWPLC